MTGIFKQQKPKKQNIIHSLSGKTQKHRILPYMALVFLIACVYAFSWVGNTWHDNKKAKELLKTPDLYKVDKRVLEKPTIAPNKKTTNNFKIKIPIIMFHYVEYVKDVNDKTRKSLNINPDVFETQLKMLQSNNFTTYYVKDMPAILNESLLVEASKSAVLTFDDGYEDFYTEAFPLLKKYDMKATLYVINDLIGTKGYVTLKQLKEIVESKYVEIGAHTLDHAYLKGMSKQSATRQIQQSKQGLEKLLGIDVKTFAYPFGAFDEQAIELVKQASFSAAVSVIPGNVHTKNELFYLYRIRAGSFLGPHMLKNVEKNFGDEK